MCEFGTVERLSLATSSVSIIHYELFLAQWKCLRLAEIQFDAALIIHNNRSVVVVVVFLFIFIRALYLRTWIGVFSMADSGNDHVPYDIQTEIAVNIQWILCFDVN